ncbi:MAG: VWA domain-containing protein [Akkermansiaceae bacterium]
MHFLNPHWLYIIPALLLLGLVWKRAQIFKPLRLIAVALTSLILAQPTIQKKQDTLDLWVLLDRSESTEGLIAQNFQEWDKLLKQNQSRKDTLRYIDYAAEVVEQIPNSETANYTGNKKLTRTALALENVLALAPENRPSRILLFTDGYSTEPFDDIADKLNKAGIPIDYRLVREETTDDFRIARIDLPTRAQTLEPFLLGVTVRGHEDGEIPITIYRNGEVISTPDTTVELINGVGKLEFQTKILQPGGYEFTAEILPEKDAHSGNNASNKWIEITGGPRIVIATKYTNDPLAASLKSQGINVETIMDPAKLRVGLLSGTKAVIFNNIPAHEVPAKFLDALNFFVRDQGGGFMMVGGKHSFGSGGYFQSSIDELLPISMELKNDQRKLAVSMAIVMDRSGSMSATVPGPAGGHITKMQLANNGAAKAIELLGMMDSIAVYAVDSEPETIIQQQTIKGNKQQLMKKAMRVESRGGGIYVYTGLKYAWDRLKKSGIGTKHIILFTDAADSEEPGAYKKLLKEMTDQGATISVIGLGSKTDSDAKFIEDIAKLGKGRIFYTNRAVDIPKLFAQETVTLARSAFIEEPIQTLATGQWAEISPAPVTWMPQVDGYNLSYARDKATTSLISTDEYKAPLVAHIRRGLGRTAAISFPLGGEHSTSVRNWAQYGDFAQTITRWLMGDKLPRGLGLKHQLDGTRLKIDLLYDTEEWSTKFANTAPRIKIIEGEHGGEAYEVPWKRIAPGQFSVTRDLEEGTLIRGSVQAGNHAIPFGPIIVGSSTEWAFDKERLAELRTLSQQTNGRNLTDLSQAWIRPPILHYADLRIPLAIALLIAVLLDALITRTGWTFPELALAQKWNQSRNQQKLTPTPAPKETTKETTKQQSPEPTPTSTEQPPNTTRQSRFSRAKKGRK